MKKNYRALTIALSLAAALLTACGSSGNSGAASYAESAAFDTGALYTNSYADSYDVAEEEIDDVELTGSSAAERVGEPSTNRKLIRTVSLEAETEEYDAFLSDIEKRVDAAGGYIENSYIYNGGGNSDRSATLTLRIPSEKLDDFLDTVAEQSNVTYKSENVEDVTLHYVDIESHKKALEEEQERLLGFMEDAETIEDLISIEDRLTEIRYQLESMESQLRTYDNQIDYSTVTLNITEVTRYTPTEDEGAWNRIRTGFVARVEAVFHGLAEFGIWFVTHIPDFLVLAVVVAVIVLLVKFFRKDSEGRKQKKAERLARKQEKKAEKQEKKDDKQRKIDSSEGNDPRQ